MNNFFKVPKYDKNGKSRFKLGKVEGRFWVFLTPKSQQCLILQIENVK